ncbi:hypothetical protein CFAM422_000174 [Trichoderma lentiforme]|uniref:Uncharacterized protein n=1 Tax=Trichoderma lentiforme TaxID=1567552 RepID=A0A9P4XRL1_9HYPO|nr:hypothetical protein CFAM422_000174 [Trichoderma lentiforme]
MALQIHFPACIQSPAHAHHPPPPDKPFASELRGRLCLYKSFFQMSRGISMNCPQPSGPSLAPISKITSSCVMRISVGSEKL